MCFFLDRNACNYHCVQYLGTSVYIELFNLVSRFITEPCSHIMLCSCQIQMGQASRVDYHFNRVTKESSKFFFSAALETPVKKWGCGGVLPICPPENVQVLPMASQSENNFNYLHSQSLLWPWGFSPYVNVYYIYSWTSSLSMFPRAYTMWLAVR